jgi:WD40 repeat protein
MDRPNQVLLAIPFGVSAPVVEYSPDGRSIAYLPSGGGVRVVDIASKAERTLPEGGRPGSYLALRFRPDGRAVAASGIHGSIYFWDWPSGQESYTIETEEQVYIFEFDASGKRMVLSIRPGGFHGKEEVIQVWQGSNP